jgi:hypothetical protein
MHERTANRVAAPLMALLIAAPSPTLANCLAPHPVCGVVLLGGIVTGAVAQGGGRQAQPLRPGMPPPTGISPASTPGPSRIGSAPEAVPSKGEAARATLPKPGRTRSR